MEDKMFDSLGLILNCRRQQPILMGKKLIKKFKQKGIKVFVLEEEGAVLGIEPAFITSNLGKKVQFVLAVGGDGTFLRAARCVAPFGVPILGINMGTLGFLTEVEVGETEEALEKLFQGKFWLENRMMLKVNIRRKGQIIKNFQGLNDVVINKGPLARLITLKIYVDEEYVTTYKADGVIFSSPTGSTAYSLSAGGPIVYPEIEVIILTPICAHTLDARPIVLPSNKTICVKIVKQAESMLTIDGQSGFALESEDELIIAKAPYCASMIRIKEKRFFTVLREKIKLEGSVFDE
ncbi:MAG: NAD(+)/NADH kinase [Clostridia bacterium]|nr:NAD(+)/NADH kinase [Clostridia bacterium]MDD4664939.1 NAD(+)/NADH kinase [Clostridia bacterium]